MDVKTLTTFNTQNADVTVGIAIDWKSAVLIGVVLMVAITAAVSVSLLIYKNS